MTAHRIRYSELDQIIPAQLPEIPRRHKVWLVRDDGGLFAIVYREPNGHMECLCTAGRLRENSRFEDDAAPACVHERAVVEHETFISPSSRFAAKPILPGFVDGEF